jgi:hypothetical protein
MFATRTLDIVHTALAGQMLHYYIVITPDFGFDREYILISS